MSIKHSVRILAVGAVLALSLTACAGNNNGGGGASASAGPVTLTMWHNASDSTPLLNLYKAYEAATGNTLNLVELGNTNYPSEVQTKWATGDRPDILEYSPAPQDMAQLNVSQNMQDLSSMAFVAAEGDLAKASGSVNGVTYAAILGPIQSFGLFYNKTVLSSLDITPPTNATELLAACQTIKDSGDNVTPVWMGGGDQWPIMMLAGFGYMGDYNKDDAYGLSLAAGTAKAGDSGSPIVSALTFLTQLRDSGCFNSDYVTAQAADGQSGLLAGTTAMMVLPSDGIAQLYGIANDTAKVDSTMGFGNWSAQAGVTSYSPGTNGTYYAPKTGNATKEAAAKAFIDWITTTGYQAYINDAQAVPTMTGFAAPTLTGLNETSVTVMQGQTAIAFNNSIPGFGNYGQVCMKVLAGQDTPQQGADEWQTYIDQAREAMS